ncbi:hypothetical protein [Coleofasciculus sp. FACHB-1120]|nr:hypothetical protein [Coleofasciculus sp. FACHB-1120]MBD2741543.1 hypothetical protein [Coleofasciculus sp. FACHB-1120]
MRGRKRTEEAIATNSSSRSKDTFMTIAIALTQYYKCDRYRLREAV